MKHPIARAAGPLRMIFWGGLLCIFDVNLKSGGFKFDVLNDFLGMILITVGVFRLAGLDDTPSYRRGMRFVQVVSVIATIKTLLGHFTFDVHPLWSIGWTLFALVTLAAIVLFCFTMRLLCRIHSLEGPERSWRTTAVLFIVLFLFPLGGFYLASLAAMLAEKSFNLNLGPAGLLLLLVFVIPLIHLFVSTSRMRRAAVAA
jgi:hypothetical protein